MAFKNRGNFDFFFSHSLTQFFDSSISLKILKIPWDLENPVGSWKSRPVPSRLGTGRDGTRDRAYPASWACNLPSSTPNLHCPHPYGLHPQFTRSPLINYIGGSFSFLQPIIWFKWISLIVYCIDKWFLLMKLITINGSLRRGENHIW